MTSIMPNPLVNYIFSSDLIYQQDVTQLITSHFFLYLFFLLSLSFQDIIHLFLFCLVTPYQIFFGRSSSFSSSPEMGMSQVSVCRVLHFTLFFTQSLGNLMQPHGFTCCSPVLDSLYLNLSTEYRTYFLSPTGIPGFGNQVRVSNLHKSYTRCFDSTSKIKPASPPSPFFSFLCKNKHKNNIKKKKPCNHL